MNVIIDYKVGNLDSIQRGFQRANIKTIITNDVEIIKRADMIILPGVGAFKDAMNDLKEKGLVEVIKAHVNSGKILVGVCLGMQLLFESSEEFGLTEGFGFIPGKVVGMDISLKVPHMGWNELQIKKNNFLTKNINEGSYVYFIHSYYAVTEEEYLVATTDYQVTVPAIVQNKNVIGMQFHPEKSGNVGLLLLESLKELSI